MALLTLPGVPQKGALQSYSLNQTDLVALIGQTYFQDILNWQKIIVTYVSTVSNQLSIISFTPSEISEVVSAPGFFSPEARSSFQIANITVYDKQNGRFRLERDQIPSVESYNIVFSVPSSQLSFLGISFGNGDNSTSLAFNASNSNELIVGTQTATSYGGASIWDAVLDLPNGSLDAESSLKIMDSRISNLFYNDDLTKAWAIGKFGTSCCGQSLPPLPTDSSYGTNPNRVVEIDMVSGLVTFKADIREYSELGQTGTYLGNECYTLIVDYSEETVVVTYGIYLAAYSFATGNLVWFKGINFISSDPYITQSQARRLKRTTDYFFVGASVYDGVTQLNTSSLIKASFATGDRDSSYAFTPAFDYGSGYGFWSCSPDGLKQVILGAPVSSNTPAAIYVNGVMSSVNLQNESSGAYAIAGTNDHFYVLAVSGVIIKYDYTGARIGIVVDSSAWSGLTAPTFSFTSMGVHDGFIYCSDRTATGIYKFNESTGARVTSFLGLSASSSSGVIGQYFFFGSKMFVNRAYASSYYAYTTLAQDKISTVESIGIVDYASKSLVSYLETSQYFTYFNGLKPTTSALTPNKVYGVSFDSIGVFDTTQSPWVQESGWPSRSGNPSFKSSAIIGEYLYIASNEQTLVMSDSAGSFTGTQIVRINILTKLIDRSFMPVLPSYPNLASDLAIFHETNNYIYISTLLIFPYSGPAQIWRIKKSDLSVQSILPEDLGLASFGLYNINVVEVSAGTIVIYPDKSIYNYDPIPGSSTTFDGKPYIVVNEETLAPTGVQSSVTTDAPVRLIFNPNNGLLAGIAKVSSSDLRFVTYNIATGARSVVSPNMYVNGPDNIDYKLDPGSVFPMAYEGENFLFIASIPMIYNRRVYNGIIRMSPLGVMNN
jgi:hypothetical protein